jgi:hypothetical protein
MIEAAAHHIDNMQIPHETGKAAHLANHPAQMRQEPPHIPAIQPVLFRNVRIQHGPANQADGIRILPQFLPVGDPEEFRNLVQYSEDLPGWKTERGPGILHRTPTIAQRRELREDRFLVVGQNGGMQQVPIQGLPSPNNHFVTARNGAAASGPWLRPRGGLLQRRTEFSAIQGCPRRIEQLRYAGMFLSIAVHECNEPWPSTPLWAGI